MTDQPAADRTLHLVLTSLPTRPEAERVARLLVTDDLAACAQVGSPIRSWFRWQGAIAEAPETPLALKVRGDRLAACWARVRELHPHDTPEVLSLALDHVDAGYLDWAYGEGGA